MQKLRAAAIVTALGALPAAAGANGVDNVPLAEEFSKLNNATARCTDYDGTTDDLLTAGLGKSGLAGGVPAVADPNNPTSAELRRLAIYSNYRALVDITAGGGYGTLYGPNVLADGTVTDNEGFVPGTECLTYTDDGSRRKNVTLMVQIPASFDPRRPCIVTGPSSGSRGVYGAIATSGEWGLKNGCAVAYTDKGTGTGAHDLQDNTVSLIDGVRESAEFAGQASHFTARVSDADRTAFNEQTPNRFAFKHAHSQQNPEAEWGIDVLQSILFAFIELNRHYPNAGILPANTIVIGSSISNGGGASVRAAETDRFDLIDGIAVAEPNVNPPPGEPLAIVQGNEPPYLAGGKPLYDYTTQLNIFQGCANLARPDAPLNTLPSFLNANRCASLRAKGLLTAGGVAEQASEAQAIINGYGFLPEQNIVQPSHWTSFAPQAVSVTYANTYARASVLDNLCGYSFGATDPTGAPIPLAPAIEVLLFGTANGIPPTGGVNVINNASPGGPKQNTLSVSPSTGTQDQNLDGALCLRSLWLGADPATGAPLAGNLLQAHKRLRRSIDKVVASADLNGTPAIVVAGRSDAILPPNHTFRPYYARNRQLERRGRLRYVEVTNAQHLDAFNALAGFDTRFVPLHYYLNQALDLVYAHLKGGKPLPPSQVVHTTPRGGTAGSAPPISVAANLPPIRLSPPSADRIRFSANTLSIPE